MNSSIIHHRLFPALFSVAIVGLAALLFFASSVSAAPDDLTQKIIPQEERSHDFKTVAKGTRPEHRFVIRNPFEKPLHVENILPSCTCVEPSIESDKYKLQVYEEIGIIVQLRADVYDGERSASIMVVIDEPIRLQFNLNVRGEIRSDIAVTPSSLRLGNIKQGQELTRTLTVNYSGANTAWRLIDVQSSNELISARVVDAQLQAYRKSFKVEVKLDSKIPPGNLAEQLVLISNDTASRREIPIPIQAAVGTVITVKPPTVFLGSVDAGKTTSLKNAVVLGTEPFLITKISCDNPAFEIPFEIGKTDASAPEKILYTIPVKYNSPANDDPKDGNVQTLVKIETNKPNVSLSYHIVVRVNSALESGSADESARQPEEKTKQEQPLEP